MKQISDSIDVTRIVAEVEGKVVLERGQLAITSKNPDVLFLLANDGEPFVRRMVSLNEAAPEKLLEKLARDKESLVGQAAVENPRLSLVVLEILSAGTGSVSNLARVEIARRKLRRSTKYRATRLAKRLGMRARYELWETFHPMVRAIGLCPTCNSMAHEQQPWELV